MALALAGAWRRRRPQLARSCSRRSQLPLASRFGGAAEMAPPSVLTPCELTQAAPPAARVRRSLALACFGWLRPALAGFRRLAAAGRAAQQSCSRAAACRWGAFAERAETEASQPMPMPVAFLSSPGNGAADDDAAARDHDNNNNSGSKTRTLEAREPPPFATPARGFSAPRRATPTRCPRGSSRALQRRADAQLGAASRWK